VLNLKSLDSETEGKMKNFNPNDILDKFYEALNEKNPERLEQFFTNKALYYDTDLKIAGLMVKTGQAITRTLISHMNTYYQVKIGIKKFLLL